MKDSSKQPLLLQLLQERRKFSEQLLQLPQDKGLTEAVVRQCEREEEKRRLAGARATPLWKILYRKGLLTESDIEQLRKKSRESNEPFIPSKEMESVRKAQSELGGSWERVLVKLNLASAQEIADAYAEFLH